MPIGAQDRLPFGGAERDAGDIAEPDVLLDLHRLERLCGDDAGRGAHVDRLTVARQIARGRVIGHIGQGALDIA